VEDGVVEELSGEPGSPTSGRASRRRFIAGATAAGGLTTLALAGCGSTSNGKVAERPNTAGGRGDLPIVNFALTLEYLESDFYRKVLASGMFSGKTLDVFKLIYDNEQAHVQALTSLVKKFGGALPQRPTTSFPLHRGPQFVLGLAATLEDTGAAAYLGQATNIIDKDILASALSIHAIEARHAAKLNRLAGQQFTPNGPFAAPLDQDQVMQMVSPYIVG
jgi:rubrerythrin